jgi:predicted transcriptional regulator
MSDQSALNLNLTELASEIVSAYVSNNALSTADLTKLIADVYGALNALGKPTEIVAAPEELKPAVSIRKSINDDFLICLDDGKKFKSLKRHLATDHNLTPDEYRAKWGLPADYPMVAPSYSATRSALAKSSGLGRKPAAADAGKAKRKVKA